MHYEYQDIKYPHKNNTVQKLRDINLTAYTTSGEELRHIIARCYTSRNIRHIWHPEPFPKHYITVCYDTMIPCPSDRYQGCGNFLQSYCNSDCWIQQSKQASSLKHQIKRNFWSKCLRLILSGYTPDTRCMKQPDGIIFSWTQHLNSTSKGVGKDSYGGQMLDHGHLCIMCVCVLCALKKKTGWQDVWDFYSQDERSSLRETHQQ